MIANLAGALRHSFADKLLRRKKPSITLEIATLSTSDAKFNHFDPADRIIAATAIEHKAALVSCDKELKKIPALTVIW